MSVINMMDTPVVSVDLDVVQRNIMRIQQFADQCGVKVRPHTKTHKSIYFAKQQLQAGAVGITVAKLGEAEIMVEAGIRNILIAFPIIGDAKLKRLQQLLKVANVTVSLDNLTVAEGLSKLGISMNRKIQVYIEIDTGLHRTGVVPGEHAIQLAKEIQTHLHGLEITGIMSHGGHCYGKHDPEQLRKIAISEADMMAEAKRMFEAEGIQIQEVSIGASPTTPYLADMKGITEIRPGTYIFNDVNQMLLGSADEQDCAVRIHATVVSRPTRDRMVIDAGSKTLTSDFSVSGKGYGCVQNHEQFLIERLSEEHGVVSIPEDSEISVGEIISIIPNHVCPVINLADEVVGMKDGQPETMIKIDARGKNR